MKRFAYGILAAAFAAVAIPATAQDKPQMPKPGPEHKKLSYFVGHWKTEGDMKPGPMGPGGKFSGTDDCKWLGEFFVTCNTNGSGAMGKISGIGVMGYDGAKKTYTWNGFNSMGENESASGTVDGKTWTYTNENVMGGKTYKGRYTMVEQGPDAYTYKLEMSEDGKNWTTAMEGKSTKVAAK
jgi:hypothetical protein